MATLMESKEILAILMESPLYLTLPPSLRLEIVTQDAPRFSPGLRSSMISWVKTGIFEYPPYQGKF